MFFSDSTTTATTTTFHEDSIEEAFEEVARTTLPTTTTKGKKEKEFSDGPKSIVFNCLWLILSMAHLIAKTAPCEDSRRYKGSCPGWFRVGYCENTIYRRFMRRHCKKTCNICDSTGSTSGNIRSPVPENSIRQSIAYTPFLFEFSSSRFHHTHNHLIIILLMVHLIANKLKNSLVQYQVKQ